MTQVPAGWYTDPDAPNQMRYWDGATWTEHRAVAAAASAPAVQQPAAQPVAQPLAQPVAQPVAPQQPAQPQPTVQQPVAQPMAQPQMTQPMATQPMAAQPAAASGGMPPAVAAAAKRARIIAFAGGIGLFILGFLLGRIL